MLRSLLNIHVQGHYVRYNFMKEYPFILIVTLFIFLFSSDLSAQVYVEVAFPYLSFINPTDIQNSGDGTNRLFVLEQQGIISVFRNSSRTKEKQIFLDIRDRVNDRGAEEGLLGLAFHPDFKNNGFFYVNYTASNPRRTVIARYNVHQATPNAALKDSELIIMQFSQPFSNHNGGQITFGPDGFFYIATGDGGSGGDPFGNGQSLKTLLGKILRIDVDNPSEGRNYGIPADNPFVGNDSGFQEEIYAYGLRNPWRFSFDPKTQWLWAADVGQYHFEEVDIIEKGKNYGWNIMEGLHCFKPPSGCDTTGLELPIWEYNHDVGASITGGYVYRGSQVPELIGAYIYSDFMSGRIWYLRYDGSSLPINTELLTTSLNISSFGIDEKNELYMLSFDGKIYCFKPTKE
ncbi:MAG: PQQ-dependent sugar dehydrogenase [Candidatus Jettenia sp.]|nr:MAG: PQQ-dependent sugar dehydrogenase [Candidatus Jettenia sp.]